MAFLNIVFQEVLDNVALLFILDDGAEDFSEGALVRFPSLLNLVISFATLLFRISDKKGSNLVLSRDVK